MKRNDILIILIAVGLAIVAASIIWPEELKMAARGIVDTFVVLTTTEEHRLSQLEPETQSKVRELIQVLANQGMVVTVGQTLRTRAEEQAVIDAGRSGVKTYSWHEIGRAVDLYPHDPATNAPDMNGVNDELFIQMHQAAAELGFRNIAYDDFWQRKYITNAKGKKIWDGGHIEYWGPYSRKSAAIAAEGSNYGIG